MAALAPDLRPRGAAELYDAALHLCLRGGTALPALALAGAVLPALSGLALAHRALQGRPFLLAAGIFALSLMVRGLFQGAAMIAGDAALQESPVSVGAALRQSLGRSVSLLGTGGTAVLTTWLFTPLTLGAGFFLWSSYGAAPLLVARGEAGPWRVARLCRRRLASAPTLPVRLLHLGASALLLVNLHTGMAAALYLGRALFAVDVAFLSQFCTLANPIYDLFVVALAGLLLEPVKVALGLLLLVDARVRGEGLDLLAAVERLEAGRKALPLLVLAVVLSAPASVRAGHEDDVADLEAFVTELGLSESKDALAGLEVARGLEGPQAFALRRFVDRVRRDWEAGEDEWVLQRELLEGLREIRTAAVRPDAVEQPRALAASILSGSEFEARPERVEADSSEESEGALARILRKLWEALQAWLRGLEPKRTGRTDWSLPGLGAGLLRPLAYLSAAIAVAGLLVVLARVRGRRRAATEQEPGASGPGPMADAAERVRPPEAWWTEADRLASLGDYREATRAIYLAALLGLSRRGALDYEPTRSNWDYVRTFRGEARQRSALRSLTTVFDYAWYGRIGGTRDGYEKARVLASTLLAEEVAGA